MEEKKYRIVYGTYRQKEWDRIVQIFADLGVDFQETLHVRAFRTWTGDEDVWYYHRLEAMCDRAAEKEIRRQRDLLKKLYR